MTLTLTASGNTPCSNVTDDMVLTIVPISTANAGPSVDICAGDSYTIAGATATNYSSVSWSTSVSPFLQLGYKVFLCDCDQKTLGIDPKHLDNFFVWAVQRLFTRVRVINCKPFVTHDCIF